MKKKTNMPKYMTIEREFLMKILDTLKTHAEKIEQLQGNKLQGDIAELEKQSSSTTEAHEVIMKHGLYRCDIRFDPADPMKQNQYVNDIVNILKKAVMEKALSFDIKFTKYPSNEESGQTEN